MIRLLMMTAAGLALLALGAAANRYLSAVLVDPTANAQIRVATIQQHLDEADPGYVLFAGDSNVELIDSSVRFCGKPIANAGIGGATSAAYLRLMSELTFSERPSLAVLTIGTNNLNEVNDPDAPQALERFTSDVTAIVAKLRAITDRVVVTALPPIGRDVEKSFDVGRVTPYSQRLKTLCEVLGCTFFDPFSDLREGDSGYGLPGINRNGVHLAHYRPILRKLEAALCPEQATATRP